MQDRQVPTESRLRVAIDRLSLGGEGVARAEGLVIFVPYSAPGDKLEIELTETHKRYARGRILQVLQPAPDRVAPPCPYHFQSHEQRAMGSEPKTSTLIAQNSSRIAGLYCGGCSWQHLAYESQLRAKRELVRETLERLGNIKGVSVKPVLGMKDPWRYRNKVQQPVGWDGHHLISGFYTPDSHDIVPIEDCLVQPALSVAIVNRARALLEEHGVRAYNSARHTGWIRHLWVRTADHHALLTFVTHTEDFAHESKIIPTLIRDFPQLVGIHQNINPGRTNVILGRQWRKLAGADSIDEHLGPLRFRLSPGSFFQVNTLQAQVLYDVVKEMAGQGERLLDLYSGVGAMALWLAKNFHEVGGVDEVRGAINDATANAELNGIENVRFAAQPVEAFLRGLRPETRHRLAAVVDPPRAGCTPGVLTSLVTLRPSPLIYVSCDPGTLARDLAFLIKGGFRVQEVQPVDLFPHTPHIETAVKLRYG